DDLDARPLTADAVEELEPAHPREGEVGEHQVGLLLLELRDRVDGVVDGKHAVALGAQRVGQRLAHGGVVIDDEDSRLGAHRFPPFRTVALVGVRGPCVAKYYTVDKAASPSFSCGWTRTPSGRRHGRQ